MKVAVTGDDEEGRAIHNRSLAEFARHYGDYRRHAAVLAGDEGHGRAAGALSGL